MNLNCVLMSLRYRLTTMACFVNDFEICFNDSEMLFYIFQCFVYDVEKMFHDFEMHCSTNDLSNSSNHTVRHLQRGQGACPSIRRRRSLARIPLLRVPE